MYSNDLVLLFTPLVLVVLAWVLFGTGSPDSKYQIKFKPLWVVALISFSVCTVYGIINDFRRRESKPNQANSTDAKSRAAD